LWNIFCINGAVKQHRNFIFILVFRNPQSKIENRCMDRPLDETFRRQQLTKRVVQGSIALAVVVAIFIWVPGWISPSVSRNRIRTAKVERGPIEATITASGTVVPEFEQVIPVRLKRAC
jgi:hypothetical protein